jgi:hypothetical protein
MSFPARPEGCSGRGLVQTVVGIVADQMINAEEMLTFFLFSLTRIVYDALDLLFHLLHGARSPSRAFLTHP